MEEQNFRQQYNEFIRELLWKEKEPEFSGEEGREKLLKWIPSYFIPEVSGDLYEVGQLVEEAVAETVKELFRK